MDDPQSGLRLGLTTLIVVVVLISGACGTRASSDAGRSGKPTRTGQSGTQPDSADTTEPIGGSGAGASDQGVTDTEILIGASGPLSGLAGPLGGEAFGAVDSYFKSVNAKGGVNGRKLHLAARDDYLQPVQTLTNARQLNEQDHVLALILGFGDSTADYVARHEIPTMMFGLSPVPYASKYPTVYPLVGNALSWGHALIAGLKTTSVFKPGMRVAILYDTDDLYTGPYLDSIAEGWKLAGARVVSRDPFNLGEPDCTALVLKMRQLAIDWWDFQGLGAVPCLQAAGRQDYQPKVGWGSWATSMGLVAQLVGPDIDGVWGESQGDSVSGAPRTLTSAHEDYKEAIRRYHPELASSLHMESPVTIGYWIGAKLLVDAIAAQGKTVTRGGMNKWLQGVRKRDTGIGMPIESLAPDCKTGSQAVWVGRWKWDGGNPSKTPETGYLTSPYRERYGGRCYLTLIAEQLIGG